MDFNYNPRLLRCIVGICFSLFIGLALSSCSSAKPQYYWAGYQKASYNYYKKQTDEDKHQLMLELTNIIRNTGKSAGNKVPPGIYAEYGFILIEAGNRDSGIKMLNQEVELYPESKIFVEQILNKIQK